jgi:ElaB/YqjD/DUF883 family membrane-anchored ribosome-binding protein
MSQNRTGNDTPNFGGAGTGATDAGTTRDTTTGGGTGSALTPSGGGGAATGAATAPASGITGKAKEYGQTVVDAASQAASQAKDYITDKAGPVVDKLQDLRNVDYQQYATQAKDYARSNPGQALIVAAAAGFVIGLLVRGGRR